MAGKVCLDVGSWIELLQELGSQHHVAVPCVSWALDSSLTVLQVAEWNITEVTACPLSQYI